MSPTAVERTPDQAEATAVIAAAAERLIARMTTAYTPIWEVSDFLLDSADALSHDPLAVAEVHELLRELAPSASRTVVRTAEVAEMVAKVRRLAPAA